MKLMKILQKTVLHWNIYFIFFGHLLLHFFVFFIQIFAFKIICKIWRYAFCKCALHYEFIIWILMVFNLVWSRVFVQSYWSLWILLIFINIMLCSLTSESVINQSQMQVQVLPQHHISLIWYFLTAYLFIFFLFLFFCVNNIWFIITNYTSVIWHLTQYLFEYYHWSLHEYQYLPLYMWSLFHLCNIEQLIMSNVYQEKVFEHLFYSINYDRLKWLYLKAIYICI